MARTNEKNWVRAKAVNSLPSANRWTNGEKNSRATRVLPPLSRVRTKELERVNTNRAVCSERRRECKHRQDPQFYYVRHPKNTRKRKMRRRDRQHAPTNNGKTTYRSTKRP